MSGRIGSDFNASAMRHSDNLETHVIRKGPLYRELQQYRQHIASCERIRRFMLIALLVLLVLMAGSLYALDADRALVEMRPYVTGA